jgi:hypothetical protein
MPTPANPGDTVSNAFCVYQVLNRAPGKSSNASIAIKKGVPSGEYAEVKQNLANKGVALTDVSDVGDAAGFLTTPGPTEPNVNLVVQKGDVLVGIVTGQPLQQAITLAKMLITMY